MSDYLNKRGKKLVSLAIADSIAQQELNYRSVLEAQRDLFERNTEHIQLVSHRDAEVQIQNESRCTITESLASSTIKNRNKDEDGNTISWLKIKSIKVEKASPEILFCRYDHSSEYKKVHVVGRGRRRGAATLVLSPAYYDLLPISNAKKADLVKLVNAGHIPEELHPWYKNLPAIELSGPERLPEPDVNESGDEN